MKVPLRYRYALATFVTAIGMVLSADAAHAQGNGNPQEDMNDGKTLFSHRWEAEPLPGSGGDGLGPVYNSNSCANCHWQAGVGGSGPADDNIDLIRVRPDQVDIHPALDNQRPFVVLHKMGTRAYYAEWRKKLVDKIDLKDALRVVWHPGTHPRRQPKAALAHRNTPTLFGAGLIDQATPLVLDEQARKEAKHHRAMAGRLPVADNGQLGRFGWRGHVSTLKDFVLTACAVEVGLEVQQHAQGLDPTQPGYKAPGWDLSLEQCDALTEFVAGLPRPREVPPNNAIQAAQLRRGLVLYERVGCAICHPATLGDIEGIFSDLLLHDMGPELGDPVPANPAPPDARGNTVFTNVFQEWRTPPLWGLRNSAPYLHDGRAETVEAAILFHGGQADPSRGRYIRLTRTDKNSLLTFLDSLGIIIPTRALGGWNGWGGGGLGGGGF